MKVAQNLNTETSSRKNILIFNSSVSLNMLPKWYKQPTWCKNNNFINNFNQLDMFRAIISPMFRCQPASSSVHYTTSYKHSLVLLRMGEIITRNMSSWLKLLIKLLLLHLVSSLYHCISDARLHKHHMFPKIMCLSNLGFMHTLQHEF